MKIRRIQVPLYKSITVVFVGDCDGGGFSKFVGKELKADIKEAHGTGRTMSSNINGGLYCYVWVKDGLDVRDRSSVITHELIHVLDEIMRQVGMKWSFNDVEPQAYLVEYLYEIAYEFFIGKGKREKR